MLTGFVLTATAALERHAAGRPTAGASALHGICTTINGHGGPDQRCCVVAGGPREPSQTNRRLRGDGSADALNPPLSAFDPGLRPSQKGRTTVQRGHAVSWLDLSVRGSAQPAERR